MDRSDGRRDGGGVGSQSGGINNPNRKRTDGERKRRAGRGGEVWRNGPRGTRPPNWYLNTSAEQNCCYHKKLMN